MFDNLTGAQRFLVDFAGAFFLAFIQELDRAHHRQSMLHVILTAFLFALPVALCAYFAKKDKKKFDWKAICLFFVTLSVCVLLEWRRTGPNFDSATFTEALKIASWVDASILVIHRLWQQAEGRREEFPPADAAVSPPGSI
jgi:hypothetical protein